MERVTWPNADWWEVSPNGLGESETISFSALFMLSADRSLDRPLLQER
jgi:hypothetical protein